MSCEMILFFIITIILAKEATKKEPAKLEKNKDEGHKKEVNIKKSHEMEIRPHVLNGYILDTSDLRLIRNEEVFDDTKHFDAMQCPGKGEIIFKDDGGEKKYLIINKEKKLEYVDEPPETHWMIEKKRTGSNEDVEYLSFNNICLSLDGRGLIGVNCESFDRDAEELGFEIKLIEAKEKTTACEMKMKDAQATREKEHHDEQTGYYDAKFGRDNDLDDNFDKERSTSKDRSGGKEGRESREGGKEGREGGKESDKESDKEGKESNKESDKEGKGSDKEGKEIDKPNKRSSDKHHEEEEKGKRDGSRIREIIEKLEAVDKELESVKEGHSKKRPLKKEKKEPVSLKESKDELFSSLKDLQDNLVSGTKKSKEALKDKIGEKEEKVTNKLKKGISGIFNGLIGGLERAGDIVNPTNKLSVISDILEKVPESSDEKESNRLKGSHRL